MNYSSFEQQYMVKKVPAAVPGASGKARFQMEKSAARQIQDPPEVKDILKSVGYVADEYLDIGAATVKGVTQGTIGLPGDLEGLVRTVANSLGADISEETLAPTTEEVKKWFDQNIGKVGDGKNPYETIGEFGALGKPTELAVQGAVKGVKATKNVIDNLDESVLRPTGSIEPGAFLPNKKKSKKVIDTIPKPKGKILKNVDSSMLNLVQGQWIKWKEPVFEGSFRKPKYVGDRTFSGTIQNESYGAEKGQHTFTIVLDSREGVNSDQYLDGEKIRRKGRNLYPNVQETILAKDTKTKELIKNIEGLGVKISKASDKMDSKAVDRLSSERIELQKQLDKLKEKEQTTKDDTKGSK